MAEGTSADRDRWEQRLTALEKALEELRGDLTELRAEVLGDKPKPAAPRPASVTVGAAAPAPAAAASAPPKPAAAPAAAAPAAAEADERMVAFLDAFYKAKGQRLPARDVARVAADCGFDARETGSFYVSDHPLLKVDGSDRVLTMAGRRLYTQKRHLVR
jgi:hypothetical protein